MNQNNKLKVSVPITAQMISFSLTKKKPSFMKSLTATIEDPYVYLSCVFTSKFIPFRIRLALDPVETRNGREISFKIKKIFPKWLGTIHLLVFNKHHLIKVKKGCISINLNNIPKIKKIKKGKITKMKVNKNILWCQLEF